jgi:hypothetical protein
MSVCRRHWPSCITGLIIGIAVLGAPRAAAQAPVHRLSAGLELQGYPAGVIVAGRASLAISAADAIAVYLGYNATDRGDFGEHDDEEGGGPGFGAALRHSFGAAGGGWHIGARTDLWFLDIDWSDASGTRVGMTEVTVLQPTARAGYAWLLFGERLLLDATVALGAEINIQTQGEDVGEGVILLGGFGLSYRF